MPLPMLQQLTDTLPGWFQLPLRPPPPSILHILLNYTEVSLPFLSPNPQARAPTVEKKDALFSDCGVRNLFASDTTHFCL